jgi:hypothetical protein
MKMEGTIMERALTLEAGAETTDSGSLQIVDTTIVLFFLAVLLGSSLPTSVLDGILSLTTLAAFVALPYVLMGEETAHAFGGWVLGRIFIAALGLLAGALFYSALGSASPEAFKYVPMSLLLVAATASAIVQFYVIIRIRLAS